MLRNPVALGLYSLRNKGQFSNNLTFVVKTIEVEQVKIVVE